MYSSGNPEVYEDLSQVTSYLYWRELLAEQITDFRNLGTNIFREAPEVFQPDLAKYIESLLSEVVNVPEGITIEQVYEFLCVDGPNIVFPNILGLLEVDSKEELQLVLSELGYDAFHQVFVQTVDGILQRLLSLKVLDPTITDKLEFQVLVNKFENYLTLAKMGDKALIDCIVQLLEKNFEELLVKL